MISFSGLYAAVHTPFNRDFSLNLEAIARQAHLLTTAGPSGFFVCGTTGECYSMTPRERRQVAERWVAVTSGSHPIFVHVGHNCQHEAIMLAQHARDIGVSAIAAMSPFYYKPRSVEDLIDYLIPIAAAADPVPFLYYDIPGWTGVQLATDDVLAQGIERIPTLRGVKFSNPDMVTFQSCVQLNAGSLDILCGIDELVSTALANGGSGAVGASINFAAPLFTRLVKALEAGDLEAVRKEQQTVANMVEILNEYGIIAGSKSLMFFLGVDCGPARPPIRSISRQESRSLYDRLSVMDLFPEK